MKNGEAEEILQILNEKLQKDDNGDLYYCLARVYKFIGDLDAYYDNLELALKNPYTLTYPRKIVKEEFKCIQAKLDRHEKIEPEMKISEYQEEEISENNEVTEDESEDSFDDDDNSEDEDFDSDEEENTDDEFDNEDNDDEYSEDEDDEGSEFSDEEDDEEYDDESDEEESDEEDES